MELLNISFQEFKSDVYNYYIDLFPEDERQPLNLLQKLFQKGILKIVKIMEDKVNIGFLIYVTEKDNPYIWLDYFAIYPKYQNKKYGTKAIQIFKNYFNNYDGIYGEIEKPDYSEKEKNIKLRRLNFWNNLGFILLGIDINLWGVVYSSCVLEINNKSKRSNEERLKYSFSLYEEVMGKKLVKKNCFILKK